MSDGLKNALVRAILGDTGDVMSDELEPGRYFFRGRRWRDAYHRQFVTIRTYATIVRARWEPHPCLVVLDGSETRFRLDRFEGTWSQVALEEK